VTIDLIVGLTAALAMLCIVGGYAVMQQRRIFDARLQTYLAGTITASAAAPELLARPRPSRRLIGIHKLSLIQAGMTISPRRFTILQLALTIGVAAATWIFGQSLGIWLFLALALAIGLGLLLPNIVVRFKCGRRLRKFESQFASALDSLANAAAVGLSISQAIEAIGRDMPAPLGPEFNQMLRSMGMGVSLAEALNELADRVPSKDVELFAAALSIQYRTGGSLGPVLRKIANTVRDRVNMRSEIQALTAQQRYSAYLISAMPVLLFIAIKFISPSYFSLVMAPGLMRFILIGAAVGIVTGLFFMLRIADVEI
jgi:tight adherence protein B